MEQSQRLDVLLSQMTRQAKTQRTISVLTSLAAVSSVYLVTFLPSTSSWIMFAVFILMTSPQWGIYYATTHSIEILKRLKPIVDDLEKRQLSSGGLPCVDGSSL